MARRRRQGLGVAAQPAPPLRSGRPANIISLQTRGGDALSTRPASPHQNDRPGGCPDLGPKSGDV